MALSLYIITFFIIIATQLGQNEGNPIKEYTDRKCKEEDEDCRDKVALSITIITTFALILAICIPMGLGFICWVYLTKTGSSYSEKRHKKKRLLIGWEVCCSPILWPYYVVGCMTCCFCFWPLYCILPK